MVPIDNGPIYAETDLSRFPVEPFNSASNAIFLVCLIYFAWRTKLRFRDFPLLVGCLPILLVGFIGGTVFHATRSDRMWLMMDFIPISILAFTATVYFWRKILKRWIFVLIPVVMTLAIPRFLLMNLDYPRTYRISVGYICLAVALLLPIFIYCAQEQWRNFKHVALACVFFAVAITFRILDTAVRDGWAREDFPHGTHFLWHLFGGLSVFCLMSYIFNDSHSNRIRAAQLDAVTIF